MQFKSSRLSWLFLLCAVGLNGLFGLQFMGDPLGRSPVLDARENLAWAALIAEGALPAEPFYRALLYPWVLSVLPLQGAALAFFATAFGVLCHGLSALLVGGIAARLWRNRGAAWLAGGLYALYPVAMWFAVQALDIGFAIMLFLAAVWSFLRGREVGAKGWLWFGLSGVLAGLAVAARPNFLPSALVMVALPPVCAWLSNRSNARTHPSIRAAWRSAAVLGLGCSAVLGLQGLINLRVGGEFRILPWQGAYNLYAANREGANGKFYTQRVGFGEVPAGMNTTRMESEWLYRQAQGGASDPSVAAMNGYWKGELRQAIAEDPVGWLALMSRKVVYLINDWEQYNNLTYAFHKERFAPLRWNPLGWGILLLGAVLGLVVGYRHAAPADLLALALFGLAYAAGLLLFFVSARFRLPLAPLLCVACGGWVFLQLRFMTAGRVGVAVVFLGLGAAAVYGNWFDVRCRESFKQDNLLLASSALQVGEDLAAVRHASQALEMDPQMGVARRIRLAGHFNRWIAMEDGPEARHLWEQEIVGEVMRMKEHDAFSRFVQGLVFWRSGKAEEAREVWRAVVERYGVAAGSSAAALEWVDAKPGEPVSESAAGLEFLFAR